MKVTTSPSLSSCTVLRERKKKKDLFRFVSSLHLETIEYEVRNTILSLKRLNNRMVMDPVSVFRVTGKLHAMLYSG